MRIFRDVLSAVGSIVLVALFTSLVASRATHGLIAEFVQVTNTSSNPVPMQVADEPGEEPILSVYLPPEGP